MARLQEMIAEISTRIADEISGEYPEIFANEGEAHELTETDKFGGLKLTDSADRALDAFNVELRSEIYAAIERAAKQRVAQFDIEIGIMSGILDDGGPREDQNGECRVCAGNGGWCCSF